MPTEKKSILQPKNDVVFKALFSRGKPRITQAMLEAILKMKIDKLELDKSTDLLNENTRERKYTSYIDRLQLKKEAEEALEKGKKEKTNEIVRRMKNADLSIEQIAQIVELKVDEVKAILNEKN